MYAGAPVIASKRNCRLNDVCTGGHVYTLVNRTTHFMSSSSNDFCSCNIIPQIRLLKTMNSSVFCLTFEPRLPLLPYLNNTFGIHLSKAFKLNFRQYLKSSRAMNQFSSALASDPDQKTPNQWVPLSSLHTGY